MLPLPQLHGIGPAMTAIAQSVDEDDRGRVSAQRRKHQRSSPRSHLFAVGIGEIGGVALDVGDGAAAAAAAALLSRNEV